MQMRRSLRINLVYTLVYTVGGVAVYCVYCILYGGVAKRLTKL